MNTNDLGKNINDQEKWSTFVRKLRDDTLARKIEWKNVASRSNRDDLIGGFFVAEIQPLRFVAAYRFRYREQISSDPGDFVFETGIAIEIVDANYNMLWRLPVVPESASLLDVIGFCQADAAAIFESYVNRAS